MCRGSGACRPFLGLPVLQRQVVFNVDRCTLELLYFCAHLSSAIYPAPIQEYGATMRLAIAPVQMMGRASRPNVDDGGRCVLMCHTPRKEYYKKVCAGSRAGSPGPLASCFASDSPCFS